ncbi:MAG: ABC transporter substrate-binding protein [Anaerolineae bacterium]
MIVEPRLRMFIAVLLCIALVACTGVSTPQPATATPEAGTPTGTVYKIGFLASVTGKASTLGEPQRNVAVMLQQQLDAQGGITGPDGVLHPVQILIQDTQGSADTAVTLVKKFISDEGVVAIIGSSTSPESMAILPVTQEAEVVLISLASSSAIVEPVAERHWVFKTAASNKHTAPLQVQYVKANGWTKIANLYVNNAYGEDGASAIRETAAAEGVEIVYEDTFEDTDTDMTAQITKIKASGAEAVLVTAIPPAAAIFTKQCSELGLTLPLVHNHGIGMRAFIDLAGADSAEGIVFPMNKLVAYQALPDDDPQKAVLAQFVADYETYVKQPPTSFATHAWDAFSIVFAALGRLPDGLSLAEQRSRLRDEIEATQGFVGLDGVFTFSAEDHVGLSSKDMVLVRITKGDWVYVPQEQWAQ